MNEELYFAALNGDKEKVENLIKEADINFMQVNGFTPLIAAISRKNVDIAKFLIENGADVNINKNGASALKFALMFKLYDIAVLLIKNGAETNTEIMALIDKVEETNKQVLLTEIEKRKNTENQPEPKQDEVASETQPISQEENTKEEPLTLENFLNERNALNTEVVKDETLDEKDYVGNTQLIKAAIQNNKEEMLNLIKKGADLNIENNEQKTALFYVLKNKEYEFIKNLIDAGATLNANSKQVLYSLPVNIQNPIKNMFIDKRQADLQKRLDDINAFIALLENEENGGEENK